MRRTHTSSLLPPSPGTSKTQHDDDDDDANGSRRGAAPSTSSDWRDGRPKSARPAERGSTPTSSSRPRVPPSGARSSVRWYCAAGANAATAPRHVETWPLRAHHGGAYQRSREASSGTRTSVAAASHEPGRA